MGTDGQQALTLLEDLNSVDLDQAKVGILVFLAVVTVTHDGQLLLWLRCMVEDEVAGGLDHYTQLWGISIRDVVQMSVPACHFPGVGPHLTHL
jgi:hypothetical protein